LKLQANIGMTTSGFIKDNLLFINNVFNCHIMA